MLSVKMAPLCRTCSVLILFQVPAAPVYSQANTAPVMDFIRMKVVLYLTIPNSSIRRYCVTMDIPLRFLASGICFPILQDSTTIKFMPMPVNRVLIGTLYIVPMAEKQKRKAMPRNLPRPMLCNGLTAYAT